MAKLGEVCTFFAGTGFPNQYQGNANGEYPFFKVGDISKNIQMGQRTLEYCDNYISDETVKIIRGTIIPQGTVVFAKIGEALRLNRRAITTCKCLIDNNVMGLKPIDGVLTTEYFYYLMTALDLQKYCEATTVPSVRKSTLEKIEIVVPSIEEQNKIVGILNKLTDLISLRKQQLAKLDELVKARFVEMFKGKYPLFKVGDKLRTTSGGTPSKVCKEFYNNGSIPWLTSGEINTGTIYTVKNHITEEGLNNSSAKWIPENSVVVAMYGATAGQVGLLRIRTATNQAVCSILPDSAYTPEYLYYAVKSKKHWMISQCAGGAQPNISQSIIKQMEIIDAPLNIQRQFSDFVLKTDKQKLTIQLSLDKLEVLKKSLMQEYFG